MIFLKLLEIIDMYFSQIKDKINNNNVVLVSWALIIVIEDFYVFSFITR